MSEFDDVLREIEVGVDISEGNYDILRYYRDEYKDLLAEVKRLREQPRVTIDDWDKVVGSEHEGPYVTLYLEDGREYIGALRLYKDEEGNVIE